MPQRFDTFNPISEKEQTKAHKPLNLKMNTSEFLKKTETARDDSKHAKDDFSNVDRRLTRNLSKQLSTSSNLDRLATLYPTLQVSQMLHGETKNTNGRPDALASFNDETS